MTTRDLRPLDAPGPREWERIGVTRTEALHGGHQSRVFRVERSGDDLVVKLTDGRHTDREHFSGRIDLVRRLAAEDTGAVGPVPLGDALITRIGHWLAVAYPYLGGVRPDIDRHSDVHQMAGSLATLHEHLARLPDPGLPAVAALRVNGERSAPRRPEGHQLLHGDYSSSNLRIDRGRLRIFDFDDCGYGPVEFEIGNTLYLVLFDATMEGDVARYERFREWFVLAYERSSGKAVTDAALDSAIERRRTALRCWLDDLDEAPIGIRTSSPEWRRKLRQFAGNG